MSLSSFNAFALTRSEMKNVRGGDGYCSCSYVNQKDGRTMSIEYSTSGNSCSSPTAGSAFVTMQSPNGTSTSYYISSNKAAGICNR
jgi:hypothetical protein